MYLPAFDVAVYRVLRISPYNRELLQRSVHTLSGPPRNYREPVKQLNIKIILLYIFVYLNKN